jgi:hypothetical protein
MYPSKNTPQATLVSHARQDLAPRHQRELTEGSGLSDDVIAERGYRTATDVVVELLKLGFADDPVMAARHTQAQCAELVRDLRGEGDPLDKTTRWLRHLPNDQLAAMLTELQAFAASGDAEAAVDAAIGALDELIRERGSNGPEPW